MKNLPRNRKTADVLGEFLNPKSMLTPGIAGAMTMAITNSLCTNFTLPRAATALAISVLLGILTIGIAAMPAWQKVIFAILNSLFIFAMAVGTNTLGAAQTSTKVTSQSLFQRPGSFLPSTAYPHEWGGPQEIPDGTTVKGSGADRYLIEGGMRRLIPDDDTFKAMGLKSENIKVISDSELNSIPLGKPLPSRKFFSNWFH
jgi:hypothetical protein